MLLCDIIPVSSTMKKLSIMEDVGHAFQLTGSRFFGTETSVSDWDFFTQDKPGVRLWLKTNGFTSYSNESNYAGDGFCVDVFVFNDGRDPDDHSQQIHVQLVKDFALKQKIQNHLAAVYAGYYVEGKPLHFPTDKLLAKTIWRQAFEFFNMGFNDGYQIGVKNGIELTALVLN